MSTWKTLLCTPDGTPAWVHVDEANAEIVKLGCELRTTLNEAREVIASRSHDLTAARSKIHEQSGKLQEQAAAIEKLTGEHQSTSATNGALSTGLEQAQESVQRSAEVLTKTQNVVQVLKGEKEAVQREAADLRAQLSASRGLAQAVAEKQARIQELDEQVKQMRSEYKDREFDVLSARAEVRHTKEQAAAAQKAHEGVYEAIREVLGGLASTHDVVELARAAKARISDQVIHAAQLREQLDAALAEPAEIKAAYKQAIARLEDTLKRQGDDASAKLKELSAKLAVLDPDEVRARGMNADEVRACGVTADEVRARGMNAS
jgi:chromosome segregation ATPase